GPSGRAAFSKGFLDRAKTQARHNVDVLDAAVSDGWSVVFVEPSDAVMFQDEYGDLLSGDAVGRVGAASYGVLEFLDVHALADDLPFGDVAESLVYHGHCNQKAINRDHHAANVLEAAGYTVDHLDSGCCGMAGSFGYEAEHYDLSQAIGRILFRQVEQSTGEEPVAPGASCRTQLGDRPGHDQPAHPIEKVAAALTN
ncbi:MAG: heterodisulfide reductase-related iron-sulfur binding cluster, partial [Halobacteriales archaeon]|nr:heterodisulfide reductase-related iron-sulfur binding cluster [Halobacteriales archaeon]